MAIRPRKKHKRMKWARYKCKPPFIQEHDGEWWALGQTGRLTPPLQKAGDSQLQQIIIMKKYSPSIARDLDFCVNDPKWLNVQTESTAWTNTVQANPKSLWVKICLQMLARHLRSSWVGCVLRKGIAQWDREWIQMVFCSWPLPTPRPSSEKLELSSASRQRNAWLPSEITWPYQGAKEKASWECERGEWIYKTGQKRAGTQSHRKVKHIWKHV